MRKAIIVGRRAHLFEVDASASVHPPSSKIIRQQNTLTKLGRPPRRKIVPQARPHPPPWRPRQRWEQPRGSEHAPYQTLSPMSASQAMAVFVALVSAAVKAEPLPELCSFTNVGWCTSATTSRLSKWEEAHANCNWIHGDDRHETACCTGGPCECAREDKYSYEEFFNYDCCDLDGYCTGRSSALLHRHHRLLHHLLQTC